MTREERYQVSEIGTPEAPFETLLQDLGAAPGLWKTFRNNLDTDGLAQRVTDAQRESAEALRVAYRAKSTGSAYWEQVLRDVVGGGRR